MAAGVTIYDIAKEAGISASTVSRVLNGSALVSGETTRSVMAVAERLGYEPRRIRRHASRAILHIVVFLPKAERPQSHLFYDAAALFSGIQRGFGALRTHLIVSLNNSADPLFAKKLGDIDGCIFAFSAPPARLRSLLSERGVPTVLINREDRQFSCVTNDAAAGVRALLDLARTRRPGHRICFISAEDARPVAGYRVAAVEAAARPDPAGKDPTARGSHDRLVETGLVNEPPEVRWVPSLTAITGQWVRGLYDEGFRALMCVNDLVATAVYDRLTQIGLRVPEDVGVTGYDAAPVRGLLSRAIATVDLSVEELGAQAADLLGAMIVDRNTGRTERNIAGRVLAGDSL